ncbi:MAG: hypothetical protein HQ534_04325 [Armatimonadetes bacterium]|nr:hypothetical protein [Armatimonadota bacterium]
MKKQIILLICFFICISFIGSKVYSQPSPESEILPVPYTENYTEPPTVITQAVVDITSTSAFVAGNITSTGGEVITERGIYYSTTQGFTPPGAGTKLSETGNCSLVFNLIYLIDLNGGD